MPEYPKLKFVVKGPADKLSGKFVWGKKRDANFDHWLRICDQEWSDESTDALEDLIDADPEFIPGYVSLGDNELRQANFGAALYYFHAAWQIGQAVIPGDFYGTIPWEIANQGYLKALWGNGAVLLALREWEIATPLLLELLNVDPSDTLGALPLLVENYLAQGQFEELLLLAQIYAASTLPDILYGVVLAHFRLGNEDDARKSLQTAIKFAPKTARNLVNKKAKRVNAPRFPGAWVDPRLEQTAYCERMRLYWTDPKLLAFIKAGIKKPVPGEKNQPDKLLP